LAEWLYEEGIGENRAILVERGAIVEAVIELPDDLRAGTVAAGRLRSILVPGRRGLVETGAGWVLVEPLPAALTEGQGTRVEITRGSTPEPGKQKHAKGRITDSEERKGPSLRDRIGSPRPLPAVSSDRFEEAGWSELLEEAASGEIGFTGGALRMSLTPAMTLFDVDGSLPGSELAAAGAAAAGRAIRRFGIGGSIGIDLPTLPSKAERQRAAEALDAVLPQPFERTAVNGFGFLQVVRRRERSSIPEMLQHDPAAAAARALLRRAERYEGAGARELRAAPPVIAWMEARPELVRELERRIGAHVVLQADARLTNWGGDVHASLTR
jgi:hypothetical protein